MLWVAYEFVGVHGGFSQAETMSFMAAIGPDFKSGFVDDAPVSNADVGRTVAAILGLEIHDTGKLVGRVLAEAIPGGETPSLQARLRVRRGARALRDHRVLAR